MDYKNYKVEDFLEDPEFVKWVLQTDENAISFWESWLIRYPEKLSDVQKAREIIIAFQDTNIPWDKERKKAVWHKILAANMHEEHVPKEDGKFVKFAEKGKHQQNAKNTVLRNTLKWAAIFLVFFLSYLFFVEQKASRTQIASGNVPVINKSVTKGQKLKIFLPDGSTVFMNSESSISYPESFSSDDREIHLVGEAFFEVAKDSLRPFRVISGNLMVTALGTSFNVKAPANDEKASVALLTGRVTVQDKSTNDSPITLNPNEAAVLDKKAGELQHKEFNYEEDILWTKGVLYFNKTPLTEAFKKLEMWYGVTFEVENLPARPLFVTGQFNNEYLNNVLKSLSHTASFEYTIDNGKIMVSFKNSTL